MSSSSSSTTPPCEICRRRHKLCEWPETLRSPFGENQEPECAYCMEKGLKCSGPVPLRKPPCASCRRAKARCVWRCEEQCERCISHGSVSCPLPPRNLRKNKPYFSPKRSPKPVSPRRFEKFPNDDSPILSPQLELEIQKVINRQLLAQKGNAQLRLVGLPHLDYFPFGASSADIVQENVFCLAAIMFTESYLPSYVSFDDGKHGDLPDNRFIVSGIDGVDIKRRSWSMIPAPLRKGRRDYLRSLLHTVYAGIYRYFLPSSTQDTAQLLSFAKCIRVVGSLRLAPDDPNERESLRILIAQIQAQCLIIALGQDLTEEQRSEMKTIARCLLGEEVYLAHLTGKQSLIQEAVAQAALPPVPSSDPENDPSLDISVHRLSSNKYADSLIHCLNDTLLTPATRCIARVNHQTALSQHDDQETLSECLSELEIAYQHCFAVSEAILGPSIAAQTPASDIDPVAGEAVRLTMKNALWCLEAWSNLLIKAQRQEIWPTEWLTVQVAGVMTRVAETCFYVQMTSDVLSDLFKCYALAMLIIQRGDTEFPNAHTLIQPNQKQIIMSVIEACTFWNEEAYDLLEQLTSQSVSPLESTPDSTAQLLMTTTNTELFPSSVSPTY